MAKYAVIENNVVVNLILAETKADGELATNKLCIEYTTDNPAFIGWTYDNATNAFINPTPIEDQNA